MTVKSSTCTGFKSGFTLIELLLVVGILGILSTVIIIAVNPVEHLGKAFGISDTAQGKELSKALQQYLIDNGTLPTVITAEPRSICSQSFSGGCISLEESLTPIYITQIPQLRSANEPKSGYIVALNDEGNAVVTAASRDPEPKRAYSFDGVNDYITFGNVLAFERTAPFSYTTWFSTSSATYNTFLAKMANSGNYRGYQIFTQTTGEIAVTLRNTVTTNYMQVQTTTQYNDGVWRHLAVTYDGSSLASGITIYIDGVAVATTTVANTLSATIVDTQSFVTGSRAGSANYFNGKLFDLRAYSKQLSALEVSYIHSLGASGTDPTVTNLSAYYKCDEGSSTIAYDSSGNARTGTKTNITALTFHYEGDDVPHSYQNEVGYGSDNVLLYSNDLSNAAWYKGDGSFTYTSNQSDPFGGTDAMQLTPSASNTFAGQVTTSVYTAAIGETWTVSFYGKSVSGTKTVRFGLASSVSIWHNSGYSDVTLTTEWQRFTITVPTISAVNVGAIVQSRSNVNPFLVYGVQVEKSNEATDYIGTTSARRIGLIPRNEASITKDVLGADLEFIGPSL